METEKKTNKYSIAVVLLLMVVLVAGIIIINRNSKVEMLSLQNQNLSETIEIRDSLMNEMSTAFDEIEENLAFVRNKTDQLVIAPKEGNLNRKDLLIANIKLIDEMLAENSVKIEELEKKLKSSGIEIKTFKNKIARLNQYIEEQNSSILQLKDEVERRDFKITEMSAQLSNLQSDIVSKDDSIRSKSQLIAEKSQVIVEKENEINKAFVAVGTHKDLVKNGILSEEGGILGIGKQTTICSNINESYFQQLDIRQTSQLPLNTKRVKLISEHPANSYRLIEENDKIAFLEIENPREFWKLTKYVILETK